MPDSRSPKRPPFVESVAVRPEIRIGQCEAGGCKLRRVEEADRLDIEAQYGIPLERKRAAQARESAAVEE